VVRAEDALPGREVCMPVSLEDRDRAKVLYCGWKCLTLVILGLLIYVPVVAEGFRMLVPSLARRSMLGIDTAKVLAVFLMIAVWILWEYAVMAFLKIDAGFKVQGWDPKAMRNFVTTVAWIVLGCDGLLFYLAMTRLVWGAPTFSFTALLATVCWLTVLVFVAFVSVKLKQPLLED
jgi:hypothetical protein